MSSNNAVSCPAARDRASNAARSAAGEQPAAVAKTPTNRSDGVRASPATKPAMISCNDAASSHVPAMMRLPNFTSPRNGHATARFRCDTQSASDT